MATRSVAHPPIVYPESDGKPMADNTLQYRWIMTIVGNLQILLREDEQVFVAGDLLWYPVEGHPEICTAPDGLVAFGRPRGDRGSYKQWEEGGIAPQVVFEILSPSNTRAELKLKLEFYERYGVEEFYQYDPDRVVLKGWTRHGTRLRPVKETHGWVSPRLGIRFDVAGEELVIYRPDGQRFLTILELAQLQEETQARAIAAEQRAEQERRARQRSQKERQLADQARIEAERARIEAERARDEERQRAERLAARLRELGLEVEE